MKRPAFQFYPGDWRKDAALQSCSLAARGAWIELMCIMHNCDPYGVLAANGTPFTVLQIARLMGESPTVTAKLLAELESAGVFSRREDGSIYSRRMVHDGAISDIRSRSGKMGGNPILLKQNSSKTEANDKQTAKQSPTPSSSSSSSKQKLDATHLEPVGTGSPPFGGYQPIVDAYNEALPTGRGQPCARASTPTVKLKKRLAAAQKLARTVCASQGWPYDPPTFWRGYFSVCAQDPWMRGDRPNPNNPEWKQNLFVLLADERLGTVIDRAIEALRGEHEPV